MKSSNNGMLSLSLSLSLVSLSLACLFYYLHSVREESWVSAILVELFMVLSTVLNIISLQLSPEEKVHWCHFK